VTQTVTTQTVTSKDGTTIAYETLGAGPAVVLVDGAMCYREFGPARDVAKALSDEYTVYIYDRRGRGESGNTEPYEVQREVEDLAAVIEATGEHPFVMGQSSGAGLALEAAIAGVPIQKLAVYEPPYIGVSKNRDYLSDLRKLLAEGRNGAMIDYFMVKMVGGPAFMPIMMRLMPKVFTPLKAVAPTLINDTQVMRGFETDSKHLAGVRVPTLVMGGSKAKPNMLAAVASVAQAVTGKPPVILEGQTHQVSPAALAPELKGFFR